MSSVLIIDDNQITCELFQHMIEKIGYSAEYRCTLNEGLRAVRTGSFDVVFLDVMMPDGCGLDYIGEIQSQANSPEVIIITGSGDSGGAEIAIKSGAWDYLQKPLSPKNMLLPIKRVLEYKKNLKIPSTRPFLLQRDRIVGTGKELLRALEQLAQAAANDTNVLITGETGTGKEVFAQTLHDNSKRATRPLVVVDCASLPENLIESTLFGHVRGAFTGADRSVEGLVQMADTGTLFLDEIGELTLPLQKTLLRVLQEKTYRPIGSTREQRSDFRLVAATNRDLQAMVEEGSFREDLYFRLQSRRIEIPPLRQRKEDIEQLISHYAQKITAEYGLGKKGFSPDFFAMLDAYQWPGNVRELIQVTEQAIFRAQDEPIVYCKHLSDELRIKVIDRQLREMPGTRMSSPSSLSLPTAMSAGTGSLQPFGTARDKALELFEKAYLEELIDVSGGSIKAALELAGLGRTRLYTLLKKHNISR